MISAKDSMGIIPYVIVFVFIVLVIALIFGIIESVHEKFVRLHSRRLAAIRNINDKTRFRAFKDFVYEHTYDNQPFFDEVGCLDYAIYQLQWDSKKAKIALGFAAENRSLYKCYLDALESLPSYSDFDCDIGKRSPSRLDRLDRKACEEELLRPKRDFSIKVVLRRTDIRGNYQERKSSTINEKDIVLILNRLANKSGSFYRDSEIWDAICRVERGKVSNALRFYIYKRDRNRCRKCGSSRNLEVDHIIPISKGGKSTVDNLQTLCHRCNTMKGNKLDW